MSNDIESVKLGNITNAVRELNSLISVADRVEPENMTAFRKQMQDAVEEVFKAIDKEQEKHNAIKGLAFKLANLI